MDCDDVDPAYVPERLKPLHKGTVCYNTKHHLGNHSDVHNLYAYFQGNQTRNALLEMKKRPFIISR